uniref:[Histone H3]-lysine(27) N-trimethyltransferase n=1 Tax=Peronospora matthiolae TaxID=2874970 RepID=A0AAV1UMI8_9STRA
MSSLSGSVILIDDSSDEGSAEIIRVQQPERLRVHSSNESNKMNVLACQSEKPRVPVKVIPGASQSVNDGRLKKNQVKEKEKEGGGVVEVDGRHFDNGGAGEKMTQNLKTTDRNGYVDVDFMSAGESKAQQRDQEQLQDEEHRVHMPMSDTVCRTLVGSKRKASGVALVSHGDQSRSMNKTSHSTFDFDCITISDDSSSLSSNEEADYTASLGVRSKSMSLQDVVAQERELARLRTGNAVENSDVVVLHKKSKMVHKASAPESLFSSPEEQQHNAVKASKSEQGDEKGDALYQMESLAIDLSSEQEGEEFDDETYTPSKHNKRSVRQVNGRRIHNGKRIKADTAAKSKNACKPMSKKERDRLRLSSAKAGVRLPTTVRAGPPSDKLSHHRTARDTVIHGTAWRNVCFDSAPTNLLPLNSAVAPLFYSEFDCPLLAYDMDGDLKGKCKFMPQFGKCKQVDTFAQASCEPERAISQEEMNTRVTNLILREQPRLREYQRRKTSAILAEARAKVKRYLAAHATLKAQSAHPQNSKRLVEGTVLDKLLLSQMKPEKLTQGLSLGYSNVWDEPTCVREKLFPRDVNQLPAIRPLSRCTAYVGLKANIRVEDDPILRYKPYFGEDDDGADIDEAWYDAVEPKTSSLLIGLDGEINELLLRLIVRECGITQGVFSALKNVPEFAQAYSDYGEMKKLDDAIGLAARRIKEAKELIQSKPKDFPLARVVALEPSLRNGYGIYKSLAERLAPPPTYFDSNLARNHSDRGYGLGLRSATDFTELVVTYRDMFCRMCYDYHCLEHGIQHPLPSHRVDPMNPPLQLSSVALATLAKKHVKAGDLSSESCQSPAIPLASAGSPKIGECIAVDHCQVDDKISRDVQVDGCFIIDNELDETIDVNATDKEGKSAEALHRTRRSARALTRCCTLASQGLNKQVTAPQPRKQPRPHRAQICPRIADESEYLDDSHYAYATTIFEKSLKTDEKCLNECWKAESRANSTDPGLASNELKCDSKLLSNTELTLLRKLWAVVGDNPCIISSMIRSTTCKEVKKVLELERLCRSTHLSVMDSVPLSLDAHLSRNGRKRGRDSRSRNNPISLERTRNNCLKGKWVNHEYEPCNHEGVCDSTNCSCMARDHTCDKACSCSRDCLNRFPGCKCSRGNCRTKACPCFIGARECNPDLCLTCGASEAPALVFDEDRRKMSAMDLGICCNVNILRGLHKKIGVAYSATHGWGAFALESIKRGEFIYEYYGALLSQDEAERRGSIYDKMTISFLFDVDDDSVVDAIRKGNKSRFANHSASDKNCQGKVLTVGSEHRISIWAQQDIAKGEELFFDYGYQGETAPDWSQLRIKGSMR